jgi:hypothetical protein
MALAERMPASIGGGGMKRLAAVIFAVLLTANLSPCSAENFRIADQIRLLSAIHITSPWSSYASDVWITNESDDPVSVSVTYGAANGPPNPITVRDAIKLEPRQHCEFVDFLGAATSPSPQCKLIGAPLTTSGFGQVVFNGCIEGADCTWDVVQVGGKCGPVAHDCTPADFEPPPSVTRNYRNISVTSRIYSSPSTSLAGACPNGCPVGPTVGQDFPGVPWWSYGDAADPLTITGIRNLQDVWHTNIGLVNNSDTKPAAAIVTLYDGATHAQRDQVRIDLLPFESRQVGATQLFPLLGEWSRLNRTRAATNAYITVAAAGPDDTFFAYGSLIDSPSGDGTTLEATSGRALNEGQIAVLFGSPFNTTPQPGWWPQTAASAPQGLRIAQKGVSTPPTLPDRTPKPCRVNNTGDDFYVEYLQPNGEWVTAFHMGAEKVAGMREACHDDGPKSRAVVAAAATLLSSRRED